MVRADATRGAGPCGRRADDTFGVPTADETLVETTGLAELGRDGVRGGFMCGGDCARPSFDGYPLPMTPRRAFGLRF